MDIMDFASRSTGIFFIAAILSIVAFIQSIRWAQTRLRNTYCFIASNYWIAGAVSGIWILINQLQFNLNVIGLGSVCGILFSISVYLFMFCILHCGVGVTATIVNLAQTIPILASVIIWREIPDVIAILGILIIGLSIPLIMLAKQKGKTCRGLHNTFALTAQFFIQGLIFTLFKCFERLHLPSHKPVFLGAAFATAALITTGVALWCSCGFSTKSIFHGFLTGLLNIIKNALIVVCLALAPAPIVLATLTASTVGLTAICSIILWHEVYSKRAYLGFALAIIGLIFVNG